VAHPDNRHANKGNKKNLTGFLTVVDGGKIARWKGRRIAGQLAKCAAVYLKQASFRPLEHPKRG
jgi:hypothetical protein